MRPSTTDKRVPADPAFFGFTTDVSLSLPFAEWRDRYADHFAYQVHRRPDDLVTHIRRIELLCDKGDPESLNDALIDLFVVLGRRGLALRRRMLRRASAHLSAACNALLTRALTEPEVIHRAEPGARSRLWRPASGPPLVEPLDPSPRAPDAGGPVQAE
jgi:hypothetical protein